MISRIGYSIKTNKGFFALNLLFLVIYSLICFVNHYNFRTYALDLGLYTRTLYDYAHFHFSYGEVFRPVPENMLSDHFDLLLMLFSPLWWVFGSVTLLVVQLAAIHVGALGIYKLALREGIRKSVSSLVALAFLSSFGIFSAVSFDYHSSVVAACLLPWFVFFFKEQKFAKLGLVFILILIAKENMALWMFFVCTALLILNRKTGPQRKVAISLSLASLLFFVWVIFYAMPFFSGAKEYSHIEFHVLGNNFKEIVLSILQQPARAFLLLFENHLHDPKLDYIKTETWLFWLLSGGFLMFYRPAFLWMLAPIMLQKMYHDDATKWSVAGQYNIEFAALSAWCLIETVKDMRSKPQRFLVILTSVLCVSVTIRLCDNTVSFVDKTRIRFYQADHYISDFNKTEVNTLINQIPCDAIVSAQGMFVPHLIDRKAVYQYPIVKNADFILLSTDIHAYPLSPEILKLQIDSLLSSKTVTTVHVKSGLFLFKTGAKHYISQ